MIAKPELRLTLPTTSLNATISSNQSYIQWQNKSIPPNSMFPNANYTTVGSVRPQMWSYVTNNCTNSFSNYSYSSSTAGVLNLSFVLFLYFISNFDLILSNISILTKLLIKK